MNNLYTMYRSNVLPTMLTAFANSLGLTKTEPLDRLGVGFDLEKNAWIIPQRNTCGELTGLLRRTHGGDKRLIAGSSLGYFFAVNPNWIAGAKDQYTSGAERWIRVSEILPCPICGKEDWCLVASDNNAVICPRVSEGSVKELGESGFLHILRPSDSTVATILNPSSMPVLIVEGATDWLVAEELGFVAIGKPSATFDTSKLIDLVQGRDVVIIGDNDEVGTRGMEKTFVDLTTNRGCKSVKKLLPPTDVKDLRIWYTKFDLTQKELLTEISEHGIASYVHTLLPDPSPLAIGKEWLQQNHTIEDVITIRNLAGQWVTYDEGCYRDTDITQFRAWLYEFLENKNTIKNGKMVPVVPNRSKISDIIDALNRWCFLQENPPYWLTENNKNDPHNLVVFKNGILNLNDFCHGKNDLMPLTPQLFTTNQIPFNFNIKAKCPLAEETLWDAMSHDEDKFNLAWEWLGHNFISDMTMEKIMLLVGRPRSGKGTYISMMETILGKTQFCSTTFGNMCSTFGRHALMGKLAAIMPDATIPKGIDAGAAMEVIKKISGGDSVDIDRKYKDQLGAVNLTCRFTISVNTIPELPDHARALESRLLILTFKESYLGREDRSRKQKLQEEAEGIIIRALLALRALKQRKQFTLPVDTVQMFTEFRLITTPMTQFIDECCVTGIDHVASKQQLFDCWRIWSGQTGASAGTVSSFTQKLLSLYPNIRSDNTLQNDRSVPVFVGINLSTWGRKMLGAV